MLSNDVDNFDCTILVNSRDSEDIAAIKLLSNEIHIKPLQKCIKQYLLRHIHKYFLASEVTDGKSVTKRICLL